MIRRLKKILKKKKLVLVVMRNAKNKKITLLNLFVLISVNLSFSRFIFLVGIRLFIRHAVDFLAF